MWFSVRVRRTLGQVESPDENDGEEFCCLVVVVLVAWGSVSPDCKLVGFSDISGWGCHGVYSGNADSGPDFDRQALASQRLDRASLSSAIWWSFGTPSLQTWEDVSILCSWKSKMMTSWKSSCPIFPPSVS